MGELLKIHPQTPQQRFIDRAVEILQNDGVIIYPTDSVYALGCSMTSKKSLGKTCKIQTYRFEKSKIFVYLQRPSGYFAIYINFEHSSF